MREQAFILQVLLDLLELHFALQSINGLMMYCQPEGVAHLETVPWSKGQSVAIPFDESHRSWRTLLLQIERHDKAGIGVRLHGLLRSRSRIAFIVSSGMTFCPNTLCKRAEMSG